MFRLRQSFLIIVISTVGAALLGCSSHSQTPTLQGTEHYKLSFNGTDGASFSGYIIVNGVRSKLVGHVPQTLDIPGLSQFAVAKDRAADELIVNVQYRRGACQMSSPAGRSAAILIVLDGGFTGSYISADKLSSPTENALIVIKPYWFEGTWVFDDDEVGLHREPFVSGVPEMIDYVVKDIPNAKQGFRLTCSEHKFPGYQKKLLWVRSESGGNYYRLENPEMQGWLCPAMFRYFSHVPKALYVRVDGVTP